MSLEFLASERTATGKSANRNLRREGKIPAVLYGKGSTNKNLTLIEKDAIRLLEEIPGTHTLLKVKVDGESSSEHSVLLKEIQKHPFRRELIHLDFLEVNPEVPVTVKVPIKPVGTSPGVKIGGVLSMIVRDIKVSCLPSQIPEFLELDVSDMELNTSKWIDQIIYPEGVTPLYKRRIVVVSVVGRVKK